MKPSGGTELLYNNLIKYTGVDWQQQINLILSACHTQLLDTNRINVLWQHLADDQEAIRGMTYPEFVNRIDHYVYVSEWQRRLFSRFDHGPGTVSVIKNAIEPIEFKEKPTDKIRLIYTSTPNRGLAVLLDAFKILNRKDVELTVYSSNIIYGKSYSDQTRLRDEQLFYRCQTTPGIVYKGYAMNKAVRQALQRSHILAYPSIYAETSCLAAIEAGAAGCRIVTTDLGALPETCDKWASYTEYRYGDNLTKLAENYAETLDREIDLCQTSAYNLQEQSDWFNETYSWTNRSQEWINFFNIICAK